VEEGEDDDDPLSMKQVVQLPCRWCAGKVHAACLSGYFQTAQVICRSTSVRCPWRRCFGAIKMDALLTALQQIMLEHSQQKSAASQSTSLPRPTSILPGGIGVDPDAEKLPPHVGATVKFRYSPPVSASALDADADADGGGTADGSGPAARDAKAKTGSRTDTLVVGEVVATHEGTAYVRLWSDLCGAPDRWGFIHAAFAGSLRPPLTDAAIALIPAPAAAALAASPPQGAGVSPPPSGVSPTGKASASPSAEVDDDSSTDTAIAWGPPLPSRDPRCLGGMLRIGGFGVPAPDPAPSLPPSPHRP
jgi:hypothetical protein